MRAMLWRVMFALLAFFIFWWIFPLFAAAVGFPLTGTLLSLLKPVTACIAVLYVLFGPAPPTPW